MLVGSTVCIDVGRDGNANRVEVRDDEAHGRWADVAGTVVGNDGTTLVVATEDGEVPVPVDDGTRVRIVQSLAPADVLVGSAVRVAGDWTDRATVAAEAIRVDGTAPVPPPAPDPVPEAPEQVGGHGDHGHGHGRGDHHGGRRG